MVQKGRQEIWKKGRGQELSSVYNRPGLSEVPASAGLVVVGVQRQENR